MMKESDNRSFAEKPLILVLEYNASLSKDILATLSKEYQIKILTPSDDALSFIGKNDDKISLVILVIKTLGFDASSMMKLIRQEGSSNRLPAIVMSPDKTLELPFLQAGADDFILLPHNFPDVISARVKRVISSADNAPYKAEVDDLTYIEDLEAFFRLAEEYDRTDPGKKMDAVCIDVSSFHIINDLYGREHGNRILSVMADEIRRIAQKENGIASRKSADNFLLYLPHRRDYKAILKNLQAAVAKKTGDSANIIRLKMGVYPKVDKSIEIHSRFDRAKHARDTMHYGFSQVISYYDGEKYYEDLMSQELLRELSTALKERQFKIYYQPKFNITGDKPELSSAEALVRWHHPTRGVLFPNAFVPLFEEHGLILKLDRYVWEETAAQISRWRDKYGITIPVSVNASRIDIKGGNLTEIFLEIVKKHGIEPRDMMIEITESAYIKDFEQLIEQVNKLRAAGFRIEMDDFGSGYSSLNTISSIPIDTLKLDIDFIRNMFASEKNLQMLQLIMQIKESLHVPVIAEGVETKKQLNYLKEIGCDIAQGYYFSKPVLPEVFEKNIEDKLNNAQTLK